MLVGPANESAGLVGRGARIPAEDDVALGARVAVGGLGSGGGVTGGKLVVGLAALVEIGALLMHGRLPALRLGQVLGGLGLTVGFAGTLLGLGGLGGGVLCLALGDGCLVGAGLGGLAVCLGCAIAALLEVLAGPALGRGGDQHHQSDEQDGGDHQQDRGFR